MRKGGREGGSEGRTLMGMLIVAVLRGAGKCIIQRIRKMCSLLRRARASRPPTPPRPKAHITAPLPDTIHSINVASFACIVLLNSSKTPWTGEFASRSPLAMSASTCNRLYWARRPLISRWSRALALKLNGCTADEVRTALLPSPLPPFSASPPPRRPPSPPPRPPPPPPPKVVGAVVAASVISLQPPRYFYRAATMRLETEILAKNATNVFDVAVSQFLATLEN